MPLASPELLEGKRARIKRYCFPKQFQAQPANKPALNTAIPQSGIG